jgi:uncharacterized protein
VPPDIDNPHSPPPPESRGVRLARYFRYQAIRLFRIRARTEQIARGFALGLIINFLPTFGFGVFISGFLARLFGGHIIAGFVGGATLTFAWPLLFYFNIRAGTFILQAESPIADSAGMSEQAMNQLVWGRAFLLGMTANMLGVGLTVYLLIRLLYRRIRPAVLALLRRRAYRKPLRMNRPNLGVQ